ncbi:MAG: hypothetical protein GY953_14020, partial [bacterium]|nr:hypothetical protein [bacterium]
MSQITKLHRERPRDRFVRCSLWIAVVSLVAAWLLGDFAPTELFSERRLANLSRFLGEIRPYPLQGEAWDWAVFWTWARDLFRDRGAEAIQATLAIAVLAIVLAASLGSALALGAARNLCTAEPYVNGGPTPSRSTRLAWRLITTGTRWLLVALRVMPEYLLAFL